MSFEALYATIEPKLRAIAHKYRSLGTCADDDDFFAEMTSYLWEKWSRDGLKGKNQSYVIQSCYYHLRNYLRVLEKNPLRYSLDEPIYEQGNSDDSENGTISLAETIGDGSNSMTVIIEGNALYEKIMNNGFSKIEKEILRLLYEGYTVREAGKRLHRSHVSVIKYKKKIAERVTKEYAALLV